MSAVPSHFSATTCPAAARVYRRRRPERTALYRLVQQHLETWLVRLREGDPDAAPIPRHVERELRGYLECGILACGFARARCGDCGHDFLVAYCCAPSMARTLRAPFGRPNSLPANLSCKGRGVCASCTTRRMAATAAHFVEQVFPQVPVRQRVVTFPQRLRFFLHREPVLLGRVRRIALRAIETSLRRRCPGVPAGARCGAVCFVQRFGSALDAHSVTEVRCDSSVKRSSTAASCMPSARAVTRYGPPTRNPVAVNCPELPVVALVLVPEGT